MLHIILSKMDNYIDRAEKIIEMSPQKVDVIYIENYLENPKKFDIKSDDLIYILNNSEFIVDFINSVKKNGCKILNQEFYLKRFNKLEMQKRLTEYRVPVPELLKLEEINRKDLPVFIKGLNHATMVIKAYTMQSLKLFFDKFNKSEFYLEKSIEGREKKEYKVYFVDGEVFFDDMVDQKPNLLTLCKSIREALLLDIYSMDLIVCDGEKYVIDVNPAAGLYMSKGSREALIRGC